MCLVWFFVLFFSSRRRHTRSKRDWSSDVCSSDLLVRKKKPLLQNTLEELLSGEEAGADKQFLSEFEKDTVLKALEHLPTEQREAIYRSYFQEKTHKEIASTMNRPLGSVKSLIRYGLNNLRKQKSLFNKMDTGGGEKDGIS